MADYGLRYYNNIISIDLTQIRLRNAIEVKKGGDYCAGV